MLTQIRKGRLGKAGRAEGKNDATPKAGPKDGAVKPGKKGDHDDKGDRQKSDRPEKASGGDADEKKQAAPRATERREKTSEKKDKKPRARKSG